MKDPKFLLPIIPIGYLLFALLMFMEGWKTMGVILLIFSVIFGLLVIGITANSK